MDLSRLFLNLFLESVKKNLFSLPRYKFISANNTPVSDMATSLLKIQAMESRMEEEK